MLMRCGSVTFSDGAFESNEGDTMIDVAALNERLVAQDTELRARLGAIVDSIDGDAATSALGQLLVEGLCAVHERQGNLITLIAKTTT
jgi:hypothetical protein